jgi:5-methylcytosine-specific restriction endonuclease McrA
VTVHGRQDNVAWRAAKAAAIMASGGQCQLCGGPLDPTAPRRTPWSTEIDHVIPLAKGGTPYDPGNLRAVHRKCHQSRGSAAWKPPPRTTPQRGPCTCTKPPGGSCAHLRTSDSW